MEKRKGVLPDTSQSILYQYCFPFELMYPPASASRVGRTMDVSILAKLDLFGLIVSVFHKHQSVQLLWGQLQSTIYSSWKRARFKTGSWRKAWATEEGTEQGVGEKGPDVWAKNQQSNHGRKDIHRIACIGSPAVEAHSRKILRDYFNNKPCILQQAVMGLTTPV